MIRKLLLFSFFTFLISVTAFAQFKVVLDAGHGGKDPGAVGKKLKEKDINLKLALRVGELIKSNHPDVKVLYTRSTDIFIPLIDRANFANRNKANLFLSIHTNAAESRAAYGTETFVLGLRRSNDNFEVAKRENAVILLEDNYESKYEGFDPNSPESYIMFELMHNSYMSQSIKFASFIQDEYKARTSRSSRGVSQDIFLVLKNASMPAVLTEVGFISNSKDEAYLATAEGVEQIAQSIFRAFAEYKREHDRKSNISTKGKATAIEADSSPSTPPQKPITQNNVAEDSKPKNKTIEADQSTTNSTTYHIQFLSHQTQLPANSAFFKGVKEVKSYKYKGAYRYYIGKYNSQEKASVELKQITKKFPQAFIIKMKNGKREQ